MLAFVHGNPETSAIWNPLLAELAIRGLTETTTLHPPGFGAPVPDGFSPNSDSYRDWLVGELIGLANRIGGPVDLVGHDWGGGHVARVVAARPELVGRWCIDIAGGFDPDYVWHDMAQIWQRDGDGEAAVEMMATVPLEQRVEAFVGLGMTAEVARSCAEAAGTAEMGRCVLGLYRSAAQPRMAEWGREIHPTVGQRGLVVIATEDHYTGGTELARRTAERWGAATVTLDGLGHWWMLQDPRRGADALLAFFGS